MKNNFPVLINNILVLVVASLFYASSLIFSMIFYLGWSGTENNRPLLVYGFCQFVLGGICGAFICRYTLRRWHHKKMPTVTG